MPKTDYEIKRITKAECAEILDRYHYLAKEGKGFKSGYNYGLIRNNKVVGVCIFTCIPVPELVKTLGAENQKGLFELSRLCIKPGIQRIEHNIASWFVSRCIRQLKRDTGVKVIISYADTRYHKGTVYKAANFKYHGLTDKKTDFWEKMPDGKYQKVNRGKIKGLEGEWRSRPEKHRYIMQFE